LNASDELGNEMKRFDGKSITKHACISFAIAHEMYHRGQLTVYLRLLGVEPVLTRRFRKLFGDPQQASGRFDGDQLHQVSRFRQRLHRL
jgi:uncharacterized damage-inducible protein DinB